MTLTLWRSMFLDLLRLAGVSAAVLIGVISFAVSVKPLADGVLTPGGAINFMLLAVIPMSAYAIPFAAAFGATLSYLRMSQDNEVIAALSGGVSHRRLLVPALVLGVGLSGGLLALNEYAIPRLLRGMEKMVTLDVTEIFVRQIQRGESATLGDTTIWADSIERLSIPKKEGADAALESTAVAIYRLKGVVAIEKLPADLTFVEAAEMPDQNGQSERPQIIESTVRTAHIELYEAPDLDPSGVTQSDGLYRGGVV